MNRTAAGICAVMVLAFATTLVSQQGDRVPEAASVRETGTIEGRAIYKADSRRPWRYARYYIKDQSRGYLAEAVVALRGKGLKQSTAATPSLIRMDQKDFRFTPETIAIRAGDSVRFTNSDSQLHNVRAQSGSPTFNVNTPAGGEYKVCFDVASGIRRPVQIGCVLHSQMRAWVFVFAHPYFQVTAEDGKFHLQGVPAGEYDLDIEHPAGNLRASERVVIRTGETTTIDLTVTPDNLVEQQP
jgi:plastocyanin